MDTRREVDTLSIADRLAIRTNTISWLLLTPDIGIEFDVKNKTWNRWTVGFNVRGNWQTSHTFKPGIVYNLLEARIEARQYWRSREIRENYIDRHKHFYDRVFSIRRTRVKHPMTTWYRGLYIGYNKYSLKFGPTGHQGTGIIGGVSYGFVHPLYAFPNGNSLDLEVGISGGIMFAKDNEYTHDAESDCYPILKEAQGYELVKMPVIADLRLGLIYRLGNHPVTSKYRYRRDVDMRYDELQTAYTNAKNTKRRDKQSYEKDYYNILREFWHVYDDINAKDRAKEKGGKHEK